MKPSARRRFRAALALYLAWVGTLLAMAVTTADRPPAKIAPASAAGTHAGGAGHTP